MSTDKKQQVEKTLRRYGVWVKAGPWEVDEGADFELMDIDDSNNGELQITEEEERLLGKLETGPYADESTDVLETHAPKGGGVDLKAPNKLNRIEEKLDALKDEIRNLKDEISELRLPSETRSSESSGGYFEDEDDETIALTDDELVNILDSADMTDETADKETVEEAQTVDSDILPKSDSTSGLDRSDDAAMEAPEIEQETAERLDSGDESIISLDEIENLPDEDEDFEDFEEISDIELSETDVTEDALIEKSVESRDEEMEVGDSSGAVGDSSGAIETVESEVFDEGEEVEIRLDEEEKDSGDEREAHDADIEEISLGEFGFEAQDEGADTVSDLADKTQDELPDIENIISDEIDTVPAAESGETEETNHADSSGGEEAKVIELSDIGVGDMMSDESDIESADRIELDENEEKKFVGIELPSESTDEIADLDMAELDEETLNASEIDIDTYKDLPGTEEVDLNSLEALASDTEIEKPEALPAVDKASEKTESPSMPSKLQNEIKDVLKYMDELLDWLPHKKVQEFERSEHFEVYRRIFEELGISK